MTQAERNAANTEWLKTIKKGDEVILSNVHDWTRFMLGSMFSGFPSSGANPTSVEEICEVHTIHGFLKCDDPEHPEDLIILNLGGDSLREADLRLYDRDGKECGVDNSVLGGRPSLVQPTDELIELSRKIKFQKEIRNIYWKPFKWETIQAILNILNPAIEQMNADHAAEEERKREQKEADKKAKAEGIGKHVALSSAGGMLTTHQPGAVQHGFEAIQPKREQCESCPLKEKGSEEDHKDKEED
jgi:hypothetical protein